MGFGSRFRSIYEGRGYTRSSLAQASGLAYNTLHRWEDERASPTLDHLQKVATAMGVSVTYLVSDSPSVGSVSQLLASARDLAYKQAYSKHPDARRWARIVVGIDGVLAEATDAVVRDDR